MLTLCTPLATDVASERLARSHISLNLRLSFVIVHLDNFYYVEHEFS
jgi:hypothetical protein